MRMALPRNFALAAAALAGVAAFGVGLVSKRKANRSAGSLCGKVVLITGGSRGLGFALAKAVASQGGRLILISRDYAELERARDRLLAEDCIEAEDIFLHAADVSRAEEVRAMERVAERQFGHIDVLINNAGIISVGPLESHTVESFQQSMDTNFYGALYTTLSVLPSMLARNSGSIVNIASIGGKVAFPHLLPYVASKFALVGWSQGLHAELAAKNIHVVTVTPGIMRTGSHIQALYTGDAGKEYGWFAAAASFPGSATDAAAAADKIIAAILRGSAEVAIGFQAIAASRLANVAPEFTAMMLSAANGLLPNPPKVDASVRSESFWEKDRSVTGKRYHGSLPRLLECFGDTAIKRYNQST